MSRIKNDRFGNPYQVIKGYTNDAGFTKGHVELGGKLYAVEFGQEDKEDEKTGKSFRWIRITKKNKNTAPKNM